MLEGAVLLLFVAGLFCCIITGWSILWALAAGWLIFCAYGLKKGCRPQSLLRMSVSGVKTVKNILITFVLIGVLTALWRAAGTIPVIVCSLSGLIRPSLFLLLTFLFNCMVSVLTGTSFGTSATMGVICMAMASAMQLNPILVGGAVMSGIFFGDRCSPVSTSALLVGELTGTDIFDNIRGMIKTSIVPFLMVCLIYFWLGKSAGGGREIMDVRGLFSQGFLLHWAAVLPAAVILLLSFFKVRVKMTMTASIVTALVISLVLQKISLAELARAAVFGYHTRIPELASMIDGGGILSMLKLCAIILISSSYAGIFEGTGLLDNIRTYIEIMGQKLTPFGAMLGVSAVTSMAACNQTLTIILTNQMFLGLEKEPKEFAIHLENSAVLIAPLVPWSIAAAAPLATIAAPDISLAFACYLYLVPAWNLLVNLIQNSRRKRAA